MSTVRERDHVITARTTINRSYASCGRAGGSGALRPARPPPAAFGLAARGYSFAWPW